MITKKLLPVFCLIFLFLPNASATTYKTRHFIIYTNLEPQFVNFIQANLEAYYNNVLGNYFESGWEEPLVVYYARKQSETQQVINKHRSQGKIKHQGEVEFSLYVQQPASIYTHHEMKDGGYSGWGTLFHEVTHHFTYINFKNPPAWFAEGLACILAEESRIVKGNLISGKPNPWREYELREMLEKGGRIDINDLVSLSTSEFYKDKKNYLPARALFYWLHETGKLKQFLRNTQKNGFTLSVLEKTVGKSSNTINKELLAFIKKNCYAGAYLKQAELSKNPADKIPLLYKALELKSDYSAAWLELAKCHFKIDLQKAGEDLEHIINAPISAEYPEALLLKGHIFYKKRDYAKAIEYYNQAIDYAGFNEHICEVYHWIANCYDYTKNYKLALQMHTKFLETNWEPQRLSKLVDNSKKYVEMSEKQKTQ